jgi:hypothetical protein
MHQKSHNCYDSIHRRDASWSESALITRSRLIDGATAIEYPWISSASFWDTLLHFGKWLRLDVSRFSAKFRSGMLLKYIKLREINQFSALKKSNFWRTATLRGLQRKVRNSKNTLCVETSWNCSAISTILIDNEFFGRTSLWYKPHPPLSQLRRLKPIFDGGLLFGEGLLRKKYPPSVFSWRKYFWNNTTWLRINENGLLVDYHLKRELSF